MFLGSYVRPHRNLLGIATAKTPRARLTRCQTKGILAWHAMRNQPEQVTNADRPDFSTGFSQRAAYCCLLAMTVAGNYE
ncbi:hypothetical protein EVAR_52044_1 [Eumeta japonica]|uniref:Uncharacterized protein n=1 Tax=Eumeta variegata TaxID=151549 RepID=A0A4C1Z7Y1_EUMVA|nr:hypothetical protein EVAR_52044_1 [Eumeta japonica]